MTSSIAIVVAVVAGVAAVVSTYSIIRESQVRKGARSSTRRGLGPQLEGMHAQLADLDAMWTAVNAAKSQTTTTSEVRRFGTCLVAAEVW